MDLTGYFIYIDVITRRKLLQPNHNNIISQIK